jgi:hypothetical protein
MITNRAILALCAALIWSSASAQDARQNIGLLRGLNTATLNASVSARTTGACAVDNNRLAAQAQALANPTRFRLMPRGETVAAGTPTLLIVGDTRLVNGRCDVGYAVVITAPVEPTRIALTGVPWTGSVDLWRAGASASSAPRALQADVERGVATMMRQLLDNWAEANR